MVKSGKDTSNKKCLHIVSVWYHWSPFSWAQNMSEWMEPYRLSGYPSWSVSVLWS